MKATTNSKDIAARRLYKKLLMILAVAVVIIMTPLGISEFNYQQKINAMKNIVAAIGEDVIIPSGGKAKSELYVKAPHLVDSFCISNGPCPSVNGQWVVPVAKGTEKDFVASILTREGYEDVVIQDPQSGMASEGIKDGYKITLYLNNPYQNETPEQEAPLGKEWKLLSATLDMTS